MKLAAALWTALFAVSAAAAVLQWIAARLTALVPQPY